MAVQLVRSKVFSGVKGPVVLGVMDGIGIGKPGREYNAVTAAHTPNMKWLEANALNASLFAHGQWVGFPEKDDIGNSEVGHNALGAGCYIEQGPTLIRKKIKDGSFFDSPVLNKLIQNCLDNDKPLHLMGLLQRLRSVHSHTDHLKAIIEYAAQKGVKKVFVHGMIDGRDDAEGTAPETMKDVEDLLGKYNGKDGKVYRVASGGGRMTTTMDRYFEEPGMLKRGWDAHVLGIAPHQFSSGVEALGELKEIVKKLTTDEEKWQDQWLPPFVITEGGEPVGRIQQGDSVIFFNFRGDRALEISAAFERDEFFFAKEGHETFDRGPKLNVEFAGMIMYDGDAGIPTQALVDPPLIQNTISELLAAAGIRQWACSEAQKYGHITYFWNGNRTAKFNEELETYLRIASDRSDSFSSRPWMKSEEITTALIKAMYEGHHSFYRVNWPNGDMVGHTGNFDAAVLAVSAVDLQVGRLLDAVRQTNGALVLLADHGNADEMAEFNKDGSVKMKKGKVVPRIGHTLNPVPAYIYAPALLAGSIQLAEMQDRSLRNAAATVLNLLGFERPEHMDPPLIGFNI